jgi:hypothetical protein
MIEWIKTLFSATDKKEIIQNRVQNQNTTRKA